MLAVSFVLNAKAASVGSENKRQTLGMEMTAETVIFFPRLICFNITMALIRGTNFSKEEVESKKF